jgi:membrane protease YdiL (CAAX protease family)
MNNMVYLFQQKWKTIFILLIIVALTFLDKVIPPLGIPIAIICVFALFKWKKLPIKLLGLFKPQNWLKTILIGLTVGILIQVFDTYLLKPIIELFGVTIETPSFYETIEGNNSMLIIYLIVSWTTAGLGEELIYRSFFLGQFVKFFENSKYKWITSLIISSIFFGLLHYNNGIDAIISTGITGFIIGMVYLKTNRNIWAAYFTHAVANTVGFLIIYSGFYKNLM